MAAPSSHGGGAAASSHDDACELPLDDAAKAATAASNDLQAFFDWAEARGSGTMFSRPA